MGKEKNQYKKFPNKSHQFNSVTTPPWTVGYKDPCMFRKPTKVEVDSLVSPRGLKKSIHSIPIRNPVALAKA